MYIFTLFHVLVREMFMLQDSGPVGVAVCVNRELSGEAPPKGQGQPEQAAAKGGRVAPAFQGLDRRSWRAFRLFQPQGDADHRGAPAPGLRLAGARLHLPERYSSGPLLGQRPA